eukprot:TRINITY_DN9696_c0_g1_i1.p1 TRINITY_DN9696_c0_g1~~TRINITY_DN9696_c0_g1_i1.p1  ORF type:complete len:270 (+),score=0.35 TRINITY_DN9696_c0_g1_i1:42-851(+)
MKKLINDPQNVVREMVEGVLSCYPHLKKLPDPTNVLLRTDCREPEVLDKVALISGGGSGHEPAHALFVGKGCLSAAVLGNVFSSPNTSQIMSAIRAVTGPAGCLLIVKNYTGDRLNFGVAAEIARSEGFLVEMVVIGDDCALVSDKGSENAGRRGIAGTCFCHKICGAATEQGRSLKEVAELASRVGQSLFSMGIGLSSCIIPQVGRATFNLGESEVELGLGIHGEQGRERVALKQADEHVDDILKQILKVYDESSCAQTRRICLMGKF